ncbi:MAG: glycosyltransferase family 2 protein [Bacteroidia bacterium]
MKIAVVILNWNGKELLQKFLPAIINHSSSIAEIIIADNGSADDSVNFLKTNFPEIRLEIFEKNYGFSGGYNKALKKINAHYFILLNSDVEITPGWIEPIINMMESDTNIAACQPKIKSFHNKNLFEHAGASGGFIDKYGYPFCRGRFFNTLEQDGRQYDDVKEIFWATGACLFIRSKVFTDLGGFDEEFFAHMEEIDLCWRIQYAGYKIFCVPQSVVYHIGGGTLPKKNPHKTYLNFRNNLMMIHKNLPSSSVYITIIIRLLLDGIAGIKFLFDGDWKDCIAVFKAHIYFYSRLLQRNKIRTQSQKEVLNKQVATIYNKSIVMDYFIRGKKYFSQLKF